MALRNFWQYPPNHRVASWQQHLKCQVDVRSCSLKLEIIMLRWALIFFVVALVSAVFGFGGIAGEAAWIGKVLLVVFLILAVCSMVMGRRGSSAG